MFPYNFRNFKIPASVQHLNIFIWFEQYYTTQDEIAREIVNRCHSDHQSSFLGVMFIYKGMLMLFGLFLAYETRNIEVDSINDSKYIGKLFYWYEYDMNRTSFVRYKCHKYVFWYIMSQRRVLNVMNVSKMCFERYDFECRLYLIQWCLNFFVIFFDTKCVVLSKCWVSKKTFLFIFD